MTNKAPVKAQIVKNKYKHDADVRSHEKGYSYFMHWFQFTEWEVFWGVGEAQSTPV